MVKWLAAGLVAGLVGFIGYSAVTSPRKPPHDAAVSARPFVKMKDGLVTFGFHPLRDKDRQ